ncbi:hypothetical protein P43SY_009514 [Pythium insidiosum]|uniref:non-specific serine/threonine protein kinase n=1 Tax=Pythium insidiosum TaxID=114742 RepID=A0AAD5QA64_PYTIN|nr:hypothetical protein P43SY_009514 [Pythium insidiosum]
MMDEQRRRKRQILKVDHYDGQCIYSGQDLLYELGGYLGGGAAGCTKRFALEPSEYELRTVAAYEDPRTRTLRELSLPECFDVWGPELAIDNVQESPEKLYTQVEEAYQEIQVKNQMLKIPKIPRKFVKFAVTRRSIHREIANMSGLGHHENVLRLEEALELVQGSKCTTFLVLELATGGELFDRIKLDCGTDEETARRYFEQLISGVAYCHLSGVCHRDLKPENLLLADNEELSTLKIADFGLSAIFAMTENDATAPGGSSAAAQAIRRLRSVVGSPHYVAPEVLMDSGQGYDGAKADAWSIGVILYAMLAGNLPFGKDLLTCTRFDKFKKWCYNTKYSDDDPIDGVVFPSWFFPAHFSLEIKSLLTQLLYPDPTMRLAVEDARRHAWVVGRKLQRGTRGNPPQLTPDDPCSDDASAFDEPAMNSPMNRANVVVSVPQAIIDMEQQRRSQRGSAVSPNAFSRLPSCSPRQFTPSSALCPPSPQKPNRPMHLLGGYMPSLDETAPLSGQTPPSSPRLRNDPQKRSSNTVTESASDMPLQFDMDQDSSGQLLNAGVDDERATATQELQLTCQDSLLLRRHQHRRNSPPELFLSRFGKGMRFEAVNSVFDAALDLEARSSPSLSCQSQTDPPSYHDLVARSTRFLTAIPAQLVLSTIESILTSDLATPPQQSPASRVAVDWDNYQLDVHRGATLVCTVEIFQFKRFYEGLREKISAHMDVADGAASPHVSRHGLGTQGRPSAALPYRRKRNNSLGVPDDFMR